jgi:hypothetical protein
MKVANGAHSSGIQAAGNGAIDQADGRRGPKSSPGRLEGNMH